MEGTENIHSFTVDIQNEKFPSRRYNLIVHLLQCYMEMRERKAIDMKYNMVHQPERSRVVSFQTTLHFNANVDVNSLDICIADTEDR